MPELVRLERRLAHLQRVENTVSAGIGGALAAVFVVTWFWWTRGLWLYSSLVPFFIGSAISKFCFSIAETRLEREVRTLRGLDPLPLPEARVVAVEAPRPAPPLPVLAEPARAPDIEERPAPGDQPRFLG